MLGRAESFRSPQRHYERANIVTEANVQGALDLMVVILSPATAEHDREYKRTLYSRHGMREHWLVDPEEDGVELWTERGSESGMGLVLETGPESPG